MKTIESPYTPGSPRPSSYLNWHEWARVQTAAGIEQRYCKTCKLWFFAHEPACVHPSRFVNRWPKARNCEVCTKQFSYPRTNPKQRFCSRECKYVASRGPK